MNTSLSKNLQVMSAENHQNINDEKQGNLIDVHKDSFNFHENVGSSKKIGFVKFCKKTSLKRCDDNCLQTFYDFTNSGKVFKFVI